MAQDGVLNSSLCCYTTHTDAGHTGAEQCNHYHQILVGVIIAAMFHLSMLRLGTLRRGLKIQKKGAKAGKCLGKMSSEPATGLGSVVEANLSEIDGRAALRPGTICKLMNVQEPRTAVAETLTFC